MTPVVVVAGATCVDTNVVVILVDGVVTAVNAAIVICNILHSVSTFLDFNNSFIKERKDEI